MRKSTEDKTANSEPVVVYEFQKNALEVVRMFLSEYKGKSYINIRVYYKNPPSEEYFPTKKGLTVSLDLFPELQKGIKLLGKAIENNKKTKEVIS